MINEIKMDELKDLFFYTFGIVPLQNYGVIGDGMTDNRLQLQQAIYDAIEVGAKYIFVPKGNYYYSQQLFRTDEVIFIGNSVDAYIKDIEIKQFPGFADDSSEDDEEEYDSTEYSTEEKRIGTWIDGKPLYRKVVIAENLSTNLNDIPHNIANLDKIITLKGNFVRADGVKGFCPKIWGSTNWWVSFNDTTDTYVSVAVGTSHTGQYAISRLELVLEYTKTTD